MRVHAMAMLLGAGLAVAPDALAAQVEAGTPEAAAEAMMAHVRAGDWDGMAAAMDPAALRELREFLNPVLALPEAGEFRSMLLGVTTSAEAGQLSDRELFARFFRFTVSEDPELLGSLSTARMNVIGHVMEGDTAHVVTRVTMSYGGISVSNVEVSSFRSEGGRWLGLLTADISAVAKAIRDAIGVRAG